MAFALWPQQIHCPNCGYEGRAKVKGTGCVAWLVLLGLFIVSFFFWPFFIITGLVFLVILFMPAKQICPVCKHPNPIPLKHYRKQKIQQ